MNWLNRDLPPKILKKLDAKIKRFMSEQADLNGAEGSLEVKKFCIDLYKVYKDKDDQRTEEELLAMGERWDTDIPELAHIQKYINRLMSGRLQEASDYFEHAAILEESKKEKAASNAYKARQSKNAKAERKPHVIDELIEKIGRRKPDIKANELIDQLENSVGNGIITSICEPGRTLEEEKMRLIQFEDIEDKKTNPLKLSGLPNRLTRIKKYI